jgi:hypothetical protein
MINDDKAQGTEYIVLKHQAEPHESGGDGLHHWIVVGRASGMNAQTAIKKAATGEGTFVAIPARSWQPKTRKVEKVERDLWS